MDSSAQDRGSSETRVSGRATTWLAWSLCAVSLSLLVLDLVLGFLSRSAALPVWVTWQASAAFAAGLAGAPLLGALIVTRRPDNPYGWVWLGFGLGFALSSFAGSYATHAVVVDPGSLPAPRAIAVLAGDSGWVTAVILLPFLLLLFPDGRLPSRRWRPLAWVVAAVGAVTLALALVVPGRSGIAPVKNPFDVVGGVLGERIGTAVQVGTLLILAAVVPSALSLVVRYRSASGVERQQIKWFAYAAVLLGVLVAVDLLGLDRPLGFVAWNLLFSLTLTGLYAAVGVAILRYRLYDVDVVINRTLVYGSLTAILAAVYFGGVTAIQAIAQSLTGQQEPPQLAIVASTLAIAALFDPLRRRVQAFIDRRFYRRKYDAAKSLEDFSAKLRDETDLDRLGDEMLAVVGETMQPAHVGLWLRPDSGARNGGKEPRD